MPRRKSLGRELKCLTTTGGCGGRPSEFDGDWCFDYSDVQPQICTVTPYVNEISSNANDTDCRSGTTYSSESSRDDDDNFFDYSEVESIGSFCNIASGRAEVPCTGNRLVDISSLCFAVNKSMRCKNCVERDMNSFLDFCEEKQKQINAEGENRRYYKSRLRYVQGNTNVRKWFHEWTDSNRNDNGEQLLTLSESTYGIATNIGFHCNKCNGTLVPIEAKRTSAYKETKSDLCQYDINLRFMFALQLMGVGGEHAAILTAFLDLPEPRKWNRQFNVLEKFTYEAVQKIKEFSQIKCAEEEVLATINEESNPLEQNLLEKEVPLHRIRVSYDMGWQVRSSGNRYASPTGHGLFIGAQTKKVLDSVVYNKKCGTCTKHYSRFGSYEDLKLHNCVRNYEGTSKAMEAQALVEMLVRAPEKHNVSIAVIVSDDDSNGRAKAKHVSNGGKLPTIIEEPKFLADPSHRKRVFARAIYNLAAAPKKTSKVTKGLAGHMKYCYGACIKRNRHLPAEELSQKVYNILDHVCGKHNGCDAAWCYDLKAEEKNEVYNPPAEHRINRENDGDTYLQLKKIFDQYASIQQMEYCNHCFDTQTNESLNEAIATVAPKNVCYSNSISLYSRIALVIGIHNLGYQQFFLQLFGELQMSYNNLSCYLNARDNKKEQRRSYQQKFDVKVRRSKQQKKSREEVYKERVDTSYGPGVGLMAGMCSTVKETSSQTQETVGKHKKRKTINGTTKQCKCGSSTHQRTSHKDCPMKCAGPPKNCGERWAPPTPNAPPTTNKCQGRRALLPPNGITPLAAPPPPNAPSTTTICGGRWAPPTPNAPPTTNECQGRRALLPPNGITPLAVPPPPNAPSTTNICGGRWAPPTPNAPPTTNECQGQGRWTLLPPNAPSTTDVS